MVKALKAKFALEAQLSRYADALETYERLKKIPHALDDALPIHRDAETLLALRNGKGYLGVDGRITWGADDQRPQWHYALLRRKFGFEQVQGTLGSVQVRCDRHLAVDEVTTDKAWQIPASWGDCRLIVRGEPGTTFKLIEYPFEEPAPQ